jgi:hypothetical protein
MIGMTRDGFEGQPASARNALFTLVALLVWAFFLWRAFAAFGPDRDVNNVDFNSDSAIPVLMSNDDGPLTIFNLYYYAADRWGGWPFLLTQLIRRSTGYHWTPHSVFVVQALWIFVGAWALGALSRRDRITVLVTFLVVLCLHTQSRFLIFELSQIYGWQLTGIILGWLALRWLFEICAGSSVSLLRRRCGIRSIVTFAIAFLATWSSVASVPFLLWLVCVELIRASIARPAPSRSALLAPFASGALAITAAMVVERLQKARYNQFSLSHYGDEFSTRFGLDFGYLTVNLREQLGHLVNLAWWPLYLIPTVALMVLAGAALYVRFARRISLYEHLKTAIRTDMAILAIGAYGIAVLNFALAVGVDHVRLHFYDDRYLTLTHLFCPFSGILVTLLIVERLVRSPFPRATLRPLFVVVMLVLVTVRFPRPAYSRHYQLLQETALVLARKAPGGVLLGSYWNTYAFTALQREGQMVPVPFEGDVTRTPWTRALYQRADRAIVVYERPTSTAAVAISPTLREHDATLTLAEPNWYDNEAYAFALYVKSDR